MTCVCGIVLQNGPWQSVALSPNIICDECPIFTVIRPINARDNVCQIRFRALTNSHTDNNIV